jgi:hypothetical protein
MLDVQLPSVKKLESATAWHISFFCVGSNQFKQVQKICSIIMFNQINKILKKSKPPRKSKQYGIQK